MRTLIPLLFASLALPALAQAPAEPEGMTRIFSGKDLEGWDGDPRLWSVKDGVLRGETTPENKASGNTFIIWKGGTLKDFDLRLSFRVSLSNNSGIQYRSKHITDNPKNKWIVRGYQAEVRSENDGRNVGGFIYDEGGKRGRMVLPGQKVVWENGKSNTVGQVGDVEAYKKSIKPEGWNDYVIIARGNHIRHFINGHPVIDFTDNDPQLALKEGVLALQLHAGAPMWVEFKDIRLKHLGDK